MNVRSRTVLIPLLILNAFLITIVFHAHERALAIKKHAMIDQARMLAHFMAESHTTLSPREQLESLNKALADAGADFGAVYLVFGDRSGKVFRASTPSVDPRIALHRDGLLEFRPNGERIIDVVVPAQDSTSLVHLGIDASFLGRVVEAQILSSLLMFLALNGFTVLLLSALSGVLSRPIRELIALTRRLGERDFEPRLESSGRHDEFGVLKQSVVEMGQEARRTIVDLERQRNFLASFIRLYLEQTPPVDFRSAKLRSLEHVAANFPDGLAAVGILEPGHRTCEVMCEPPEGLFPKRLVVDLINETMAKGTTVQHTLLDRSADHGYQAAVFEPLMGPGAVMGALGVLVRREAGEDDVKALRLMARAASYVFSNLTQTTGLRRQADLMEELYSAGAKMSPLMSLEERLSEATDQIVALFDFKRVSLFMVQDSKWTRFDAEMPVPVTVAEAMVMARRLRGVKVIDNRMLVGPLAVNDQVLGYVFADRDGRECEVDKHQAGLISLFLDRVALCLYDARLFAELQAKCRELSGVQDISNSFSVTKDRTTIYGEMVKKIAALTGTTKVVITLFDRERNAISVQLPGHGDYVEAQVSKLDFDVAGLKIAQEVLQTGRGFYHNDMSTLAPASREEARRFGLKSLLAVPLKAKGESIGIIYAADKMGGLPFSDTDLDLFTFFANQAAVVIENARYYEETHRRIRDLAILSEMQQQFSASLEVNDVLNTIVRVVQEKTDYEFCGIGLYEEYSKEIVARAWSGQDPNTNVMIRTPLGKGIIGNAVMVGEPILVSDVSRDENYIDMIPGVRSELAMPIKSRGKVLGVLDIESRRLNAFSSRDVEFLKTVANLAGLAIDNALLYHESEMGFIETVKALVMMIDANDPYTRGHSERVMTYATLISERLGLNEEEVTQIRYAALLHDIGKIGISEAILAKREKLTDDEIDELRLHPLIGAQMLDEIKYFKKIRFLIRTHHEFYNGGGYPYGLKGEAIPLGARIIAVADTYEALTSDRPYRPAFSQSHAMELMKENAGTKLDPNLVAVFIEVLKEEELEGI